jgi:hypothetical protein
VVARWSAPYAARPDVQNLVAFGRRDSTHWASASWRDSGAGYADGRFAMDVNAVWVPHALEAAGQIFGALAALGLPADARAGGEPALAPDAPLGRYLRDPAALRRAVATWRGAERHFLVRLDRPRCARAWRPAWPRCRRRSARTGRGWPTAPAPGATR